MNSFKTSIGIIIISGLMSFNLQGQHTANPGERDSAHNLKHNRFSLLLYHSYVNTETSAGQHLHVIPAMGLDYEYWFSSYWGLGLHNDLLITHKIEQDLLSDRAFPILATLNGLWKPYTGIVLLLGPGVEFENHEHTFFLRSGIEFEIELRHHWDVCPTLFFDNRKSAFDSNSFGLGLGKRF